MTGTVRKFSPQNGWGFITAQEGRDVFVHSRQVCPDINGHQLLYAGDQVEFVLEEKPGKTCEASSVTIVSPIAPVELPAPRETGRVFFIQRDRRYGLVSRDTYCAQAMLSGAEIERTGIQLGDHIEFEPVPSKSTGRNGRKNWDASQCVVLPAAPSHGQAEMQVKYTT